MARGGRTAAPVEALVLDSTLHGLLCLVFGLGQAGVDHGALSVGPGLATGAGLLPALTARRPGAPEVVVAWSDRGVREATLSAFLAAVGQTGPTEVFLFDPAAAPPAPGLLGYLLEQGRAGAIPNRDGVLESRALGLGLRAEGARLRVHGTGNAPVPFPDELAEQARRAAADAARWRQRAERKEEENARLRAEVDRQRSRADHWKSEARKLRERG